MKKLFFAMTIALLAGIISGCGDSKKADINKNLAEIKTLAHSIYTTSGSAEEKLADFQKIQELSKLDKEQLETVAKIEKGGNDAKAERIRNEEFFVVAPQLKDIHELSGKAIELIKKGDADNALRIARDIDQGIKIYKKK